jgi:16S rRNA (uracil1498-N3)-methyltransferase
MQVFYVTETDGISCVLDETESRHAIRVLRMTRGDVVNITDGTGGLYEGIITDPDPKSCKIKITAAKKEFEKRDYRLHIAISPLKNHDRFEWFVEKSVEIGVDEITPLICHNTEKPGVKSDRINNIIISAMKQSLKAFRPVLNEPEGLNEFICREFSSTKMIAHCSESTDRNGIKDVYSKGSDAVIMIGPEGDFSEDEIMKAIDKGFIPVHLGTSRLRTETAGIAACSAVYFVNS